MNDDNTRCGEMFFRVNQLGVDEAAIIASCAFVKDLFDSLSTIITELVTHAGAQASGLPTAQQGTRSKGAARAELERDLNAITRTARSMSVIMPGLEQKFRSARHLKDQDLLTTARM